LEERIIENLITKTSMLVNYFTEDGLIKNTGVSKDYWDFVIYKELVDNALDAIESKKEKHIYINLDTKDNKLQIFDNGNGISIDTINDIFDFSFFISKNRDYVTPSRGKQGNGLKTIISIC
jgi:sensor histidine kinase regulating citrate/malate metabolism